MSFPPDSCALSPYGASLLQESFANLHHLLAVAQRVSPVSLRAVVGTKADLQDSREITTQEALVCG